MASSAASYDEKNIKSLSSLEHIRTRTGMYIGRTADGSQYTDGIYILLKEVVDNAVDEFMMGFGKKLDITLDYNSGIVSVRDYGRGIPLGKVVECVSQINTGGKFDTAAFQFSAGMNGVGTKAVNALSTDFYVKAVRDGEFADATFKVGKLVSQHRGKCKDDEPNGTFVRFHPDDSIFKKFQFREEHVERRMKMYAYLNAGLTINLNGTAILSENGLADLIADSAQFEKLYKPFHFRSKMLEFIFTHTNRFSEDYYSFVNGQFTEDGGTHLSAFKEGMLRAINEFSPKDKFDGDDVREGIIGAISIRMQNPVFEGQTKNKLGSAEIRSELVDEIRTNTLAMLHRDPAEAEKLLQKIRDTSSLRKELNTIKKKARENAKAVSIHVPQLKDCKDHLDLAHKKGEDTMIFLTEGLSAYGTITQCRDPKKQAVFALRGKPLNVCDEKRDAIYKNQELFNLMKSLDVEDTLVNLRYGKIIFATDADVDGMHIRNLLITFFMRFFPQLVKDGRVFILETPLFRVRNKKESHYCYSDPERLAAIKACGAAAEISRFKGLGEISPKEFTDFIGPEMRLTPVTCSHDVGTDQTLEFYMGKNTPERRDYIMKNLVITEEDYE